MNNNVVFVCVPCSTLFNAHIPTKLALRVSVSMAMIYCLFLLRAWPRECLTYSMANEQSLESLNDERLNTSDLGKR